VQGSRVSRTYYVTHIEQQGKKEHAVLQWKCSASISQTEKGCDRLHILTSSMGSVKKGKNVEQNIERQNQKCSVKKGKNVEQNIERQNQKSDVTVMLINTQYSQHF